MISKEELIELLKYNSIYDVSKLLDYSHSTIQDYCHKYDISIKNLRSTYPIKRKSNKKKDPGYNVLYKKYIIDLKSTTQIAKEFNATQPQVCKWLQKYNIKTRQGSKSFSNEKIINKLKTRKVVYTSDVIKNMSNAQIGKKWSDEQRIKMAKIMRKNVSEPNRLKLYDDIRKSWMFRRWRDQVFKRDQYSCQLCKDNKGGNLNADHIVPFAVLMKINNIFSLEDAEKCDKFWSLENGRTLCVECHKKTETYGQKTRNLLKELG